VLDPTPADAAIIIWGEQIVAIFGQSASPQRRRHCVADFFQQTDFLPSVYSLLLIATLIQGIIAFRRPGLPDCGYQSVVSQKSAVKAGLFLFLLFIFGAAISLLDPSWHRLTDQILLDSNFETHLKYVFPSILSGIANVWLGIGMLIIIVGFSRLLNKKYGIQDVKWIIFFLIFFSLVAVFTTFLFLTLYFAISWQINCLHLKSTVGQLILFLGVSGGILFSSVFYRIIPHIPLSRKSSLIGIVALTFGAAILFPLTWLLTNKRNKKTYWILLLISILAACLLIGYAVLFGDLFNPWFTTYSYLKGAILKIISVVAAGTALLLIEPFLPLKSAAPSDFGRLAIALAITAVLGYFPCTLDSGQRKAAVSEKGCSRQGFIQTALFSVSKLGVEIGLFCRTGLVATFQCSQRSFGETKFACGRTGVGRRTGARAACVPKNRRRQNIPDDAFQTIKRQHSLIGL
jgi:MFS family permease